MCEVRKAKPKVNTIMVLDSAGVPIGPLTGNIVIQLSNGLGFDYDQKTGTAYIGVSHIWLEQEVKRVLTEQGFNIQP